jgi:hypothetical protein
MNRWNDRQVLECGDGVCAVAALDLKPARSGWTEAPESSYAKAVNRCALPRIPRRWRSGPRFMVPDACLKCVNMLGRCLPGAVLITK